MQPFTYQDQEHLKILSVFHYIVAGFVGLMSCMFLLQVALQLLMVVMSIANHNSSSTVVSLVMLMVPSGFLLCGWTMAFLMYKAGKLLPQHQRYSFCLTIACLMLIIIPFGTVLGIFSLIVLLRPQVKEMFAARAAALFSAGSGFYR